MPSTRGPWLACGSRDSGRAFFEYAVPSEPADNTLSVSLLPCTSGRAVDGDVTALGTGGELVGFSCSSMTEGATLDIGESPSSILRVKRLRSSSISELNSVSSVFRFEYERLCRMYETGVMADGVSSWSSSSGRLRWATEWGEYMGEDRAIDRWDAVSPSEKATSEEAPWSSCSGSGCKRKWVLSASEDGESSNGDGVPEVLDIYQTDTAATTGSADRTTAS